MKVVVKPYRKAANGDDNYTEEVAVLFTKKRKILHATINENTCRYDNETEEVETKLPGPTQAKHRQILSDRGCERNQLQEGYHKLYISWLSHNIQCYATRHRVDM